MRALVLVVLTILTTACTTAPSEPAGTACPTLVAYSPAMQEQARQELAGLPPGAALRAMMGDYRRVLCEIRVCRGEIDPCK